MTETSSWRLFEITDSLAAFFLDVSFDATGHIAMDDFTTIHVTFALTHVHVPFQSRSFACRNLKLCRNEKHSI